MAKIKEEQKVKLFSDEDTQGLQEVSIDTDDECGPWLNVIHNGYEIPLSLDNWEKLVLLVETAKSKIHI